VSAPYVDASRARAGKRVFRLVHVALREVGEANDGRGRYRDCGYTYDVAGTADETQHVALGGCYGARGDRVAYGIAPEDASRLAGRLRAIGCKLRNSDADALLLQAEMGALRCAPPPATPEQERTKKANRRAWARENGICLECCCRPTREGQGTCLTCAARKAEEHQARKARRGTKA
jgi:hypothetical protein